MTHVKIFKYSPNDIEYGDLESNLNYELKDIPDENPNIQFIMVGLSICVIVTYKIEEIA